VTETAIEDFPLNWKAPAIALEDDFWEGRHSLPSDGNGPLSHYRWSYSSRWKAILQGISCRSLGRSWEGPTNLNPNNCIL